MLQWVLVSSADFLGSDLMKNEHSTMATEECINLPWWHETVVSREISWL